MNPPARSPVALATWCPHAFAGAMLLACAGDRLKADDLESEVLIRTPIAEIAGTLRQAPNQASAPLVVLIGGTLSQTRDGGLVRPGTPPRDALRRWALQLCEAGYASLRFDRVGFGESQPGDGWTGTYHDEAMVAAAAIRWARGQGSAASVIAIGESAGAYLACLAAEAGTQADAYVFLGGFCGPSQELYQYNFGRLAEYASSSPERLAWATSHARRDLALGRHYPEMLAAAIHGAERFELVDGDFRASFELARRREEAARPPDAMFRFIRRPTLAIAGREDLNVPPDHAWRIARHLHEVGNTNVASLLISGCDHSFQWSAPEHDDAFRERYTLESFRRGYHPGAYQAVITWLQKILPSTPATSAPKPTTPAWQRAIAGPELDPRTPSTPTRVQLAPGVEVLDDITDADRLAGVETLEGRIGPLLLAEGCQAHFIDMPAGLYVEEHPHATESLIYTVRGQWVLCSQGRRQLMKPGSLFRFGSHISTGYEVPFTNDAYLLIFKGDRTTDQESDFMGYLRDLADRLRREERDGHEFFRLLELPVDHPARAFGRQVNPDFTANRPPNDGPSLETGPTSVDANPLTVPPLENVFQLGTRLYSGSQPEGDTAFATLAQLGVKTVISVDGAIPDIEAAHRHGLRYVHLPIGYDGVPPSRVPELARATVDFPGPWYVHCHHGRHRGPAAAAVLGRILDGWKPDQAVAWMRRAGTSAAYAGLFKSVEQCRLPTPREVRALAGELPEKAVPTTRVESMVRMDASLDRLKSMANTGWQPPADHPDLTPVGEATVLWELLREAARLETAANSSLDYRRRLSETEAAADRLRAALGRQSPPEEPRSPQADQALTSLISCCTDCHRTHRN